MDRKKDGPPPGPQGKGFGGQVSGEGGGGPEAAFDLWLEQKLHQLYDSVAEEPVPPELLALIEADRQRRGG